MIIEAELREEIARVAVGRASLGDLYRWLMARNWNVLRDSLPRAAALAVDVEDVLLEWSDRGDAVNENQFREALSKLLNDIDGSPSEPVAIIVPLPSQSSASPSVIWLSPPALALLPV